MTILVAPTESNIRAALRAFLLAVLPGDVEVIAGQPNRVPEPKSSRYVVMAPPQFTRLRTNIDSNDDVRFTGSIAGSLLTVSAVAFGTIRRGAILFGTGVAANTVIAATGGTGTGGIGTYPVSVAQALSSRTLAAGQLTIEQGVQASIKLDFHSADATAGDLAQVVTTLMRDEFATRQFEGQSPDYGVVPLFADDARQMPFFNDQQQLEWRWVVEAMLQADQVVSVPQQYADSVSVEVVSVEASYPPA